MRSMTGYGKASLKKGNRMMDIEIKSVNHRYRDLNIRMPRAFQGWEAEIRSFCFQKIFRGKVDMYIHFKSEAREDFSFEIHEIMSEQYMEALKGLSEKFNVEAPTLELLLNFPDIISPKEDILEGAPGKLIKDLLFQVLDQSMAAFMDMREREGNLLKINMLEKNEIVKSKLELIKENAPLVLQANETRLRERLKSYVQEGVDENRLLTEIAILGDKVAIDEEIVRLESHLHQLEKIAMEKNDMGRKLDFLLQEINREINTIGSKSNDLAISNITIEMKAEIEKIREQVQNIE